jgi:hypothetical protein
MALFDSPDEALAEVSRDLENGFADVFLGVEDGAEGARAAGPFANTAIGADGISVVAWEWTVEQVGPLPGVEPLQGTPATHKVVTIRGVTIIDGRRPTPRYARYIDWLALYADLGAVTIARPAVDHRLDIERNVPHPVDAKSAAALAKKTKKGKKGKKTKKGKKAG